MVILGIETSCDETAAAILEQKNGRVQILSNVVASSASLQAKYGGVIPEQAAREQLKSIIPVIVEALIKAFPDVIPAVRQLAEGIQLTSSSLKMDPRLRGDDIVGRIDAIAVTQGPGLIGSLLVGVETAKTLALTWDKKIIPVNHLIGHFYANWITVHLEVPSFPCLGLLVSGGHTDLVLFTSHGKYDYIGGTRDDAAGECFDKCAKLLGLPYPGGPNLSKLAQKGNPKAFNLPRPMIDSDDFDFSFSGLKTAVSRLASSSEFIVHGKKSTNNKLITKNLSNLAASIEQAIVDVLVSKTIKAVKHFKVNQIIAAGGVAANNKLRDELKKNCSLSVVNCQLHIPPPSLCTDNAAMVAAAAFFQKPIKDPLKIQANPNLSLAY